GGVREVPQGWGVDGVCSGNFGGRLLRAARAASDIGLASFWRMRSTSARMPYSERRDSRIAGHSGPKSYPPGGDSAAAVRAAPDRTSLRKAPPSGYAQPNGRRPVEDPRPGLDRRDGSGRGGRAPTAD